MARLTPETSVLRALFARSGNQCAFPGCIQALVNSNNLFIAQVCHIEAAESGGQRYNKSQNDEERRSYDNLLLMCYPHHIETNNAEEYPTPRMQKIKEDHERTFEKLDFKIDEGELFKLIHQMDDYWNDVERLNKYEHLYENLAIEINAEDSGTEIIDSARSSVDDIEELIDTWRDSDTNLFEDFTKFLESKDINPNIFDDVEYEIHPFVDRNWESHSLSALNIIQNLRITLVHMEVKYLEEYLKTNSNDKSAKARQKEVMKLFKEIAQQAMYYD